MPLREHKGLEKESAWADLLDRPLHRFVLNAMVRVVALDDLHDAFSFSPA